MVRRFIATLALVTLIPAQIAAAELTVSGQGSVRVAPDMGVIQVGIRKEARQASDALSAAAAATGEILETLDGLGIPSGDIQTTAVSLTPNYQYSNDGTPPRFVGYAAGSNLTVRIMPLDTLGAVLDGLTLDGATSFSGPTLQVADPLPHEDAALAAAVRDARRKAELVAVAADVALGPVLSITEAGTAPPSPLVRGAMMEAAADRSMPIAAGEITFTANVTAVFDLADD